MLKLAFKFYEMDSCLKEGSFWSFSMQACIHLVQMPAVVSSQEHTLNTLYALILTMTQILDRRKKRMKNVSPPRG